MMYSAIYRRVQPESHTGGYTSSHKCVFSLLTDDLSLGSVEKTLNISTFCQPGREDSSSTRLATHLARGEGNTELQQFIECDE
jgi:hypothetical protein